MSTRTVLRPNLLDPVDLSATGASQATILQSLDMLRYDVSWSGTTPVGTLSLETSGDYALGASGVIINAGTWKVAPMFVNGVYATSVAISGNTGVGTIDVLETAGYAFRLLYTRSSGTGTMSIIVSGKVG